MDQSLPQDILLAKIQGSFITNETLVKILDQRQPNLSDILNNNFNFLTQKYSLILNPGNAYERFQELYMEFIKQIEQQFNSYITSLKNIGENILKDVLIQQEKNKAELNQFQIVLTKAYQVIEQEHVSDVDCLWLINTLEDPNSDLQTDLLNMNLSSNEQLLNQMADVQKEQIRLTSEFYTQFEKIAFQNFYADLNKMINSQNKYLHSKTQSNIQMHLELSQYNRQSLLNSSQVQQQEQSVGQIVAQIPQIQLDECDIQLMISQLLKSREETHQLMEDHIVQASNKSGKKHAKIQGGGSFGFCWTGGYGWRGLHYQFLGLKHDCPECEMLNKDMHNTAKRLYELDYRDKGGWWVQVWFLYPK